MLDIAVLRVIWWVLLGVLLMGFAVMDGFDFGVAVLLPFITRNEKERSIVLNTIRPFWEGNQVWIILGAGAMFAAWPFIYAIAFSGAYFVIFLLLLSMGISRPVSFKYRSKLPNVLWRRCWDWIVFFGGLMPAILLGLLVGNALTGLPFSFDKSLRVTYSGNIIHLMDPFAWWCGATSLAMFVMHGGLYLAMKTYDPIARRAINFSRVASIMVILLFAGGGIWTAYYLSGYQVISGADPYGYSNPLHKQVLSLVGAWIHNYTRYPWLFLVPILGFIGALGAFIMAPLGHSRIAFILSSLSIIGIIATVGVSMFPFILPSSIDLTSSLLVWDSSSSELTLLVMLVAAIIFLPLIFLYTTWVYRVLRGKVNEATAGDDKHAY
jgi:cytochrome d ubiquinol oxidase subunit II